MSQSLTTYEVDKDERNAYIKDKTYNICDIKSEYVLISKNLYQHLMSHYAGSVIKSQFEKKGYNIMADINIETFYGKLDEKEEKLSDKIDSKYEKLDKKIDDSFRLLHNDIKEINTMITQKDGINDKLSRIDERTRISLKNWQVWISVLVAVLTAFLSALFEGKIHF